MPGSTVYRSANADVLANAADREEARRRWEHTAEALRDHFGFTGKIVVVGDRIVGFEHHGTPPPGTGWMTLEAGELAGRAVVPDATPAGREIDWQLGRPSRPDPRAGLPGGMPYEWVDLTVLPPAPRKARYAATGDAVYLAWTPELPAEQAAKVDPAVWGPATFEEFDAAVEVFKARVLQETVK